LQAEFPSDLGVIITRQCCGDAIVLGLEEPTEEFRGFLRDSGKLVCRLTIEFEIQFRFGPAIIPIGKRL
jgi:hypothetical protein